MGSKGDLSDSECGLVVGARLAGLSISQIAYLLEFSWIHPHWDGRVRN